jgi:response regulator RpfG family c-di-GMP phosphodiesterase
MAARPEDRYPTPQSVLEALLPFLKPDCGEPFAPRRGASASTACLRLAENVPGQKVCQRILLVDDEAEIRKFCRHALQFEGLECDEAENGVQAMEALHAKAYDLVILDVNMPEMSGGEVLRRLREAPPSPHLKVILLSGGWPSDEIAKLLMDGAHDFLVKPCSVIQLLARVKAALRVKEILERSDELNLRLVGVNAELEQNLMARDGEVTEVCNTLIMAMAKLGVQRCGESPAGLLRLQRYCRCLAEEAASSPAFARQIDGHFINVLECSAPLYDIGKIKLPEHIFLKPGKLAPDERIIMQSHPALGAETLQEIVDGHRNHLPFLHMAIDIARHHHEHYDGTGYPDGLAGDAIPLAARIVTVGDVYDALRSRRTYRPALAHQATLQVMTVASASQFDPYLLQAFQRCAPQFERIFKEIPD